MWKRFFGGGGGWGIVLNLFVPLVKNQAAATSHGSSILPTAAKEKAKAFKLNGESFDDVNEAIKAAKLHAAAGDIIIVCGSVFLVAEVDKELF